jgi:hypothetical protein
MVIKREFLPTVKPEEPFFIPSNSVTVRPRMSSIDCWLFRSQRFSGEYQSLPV